MTLQNLLPERVRHVLAETVRETIIHRLAEAQPGHCLRADWLTKLTQQVVPLCQK